MVRRDGKVPDSAGSIFFCSLSQGLGSGLDEKSVSISKSQIIIISSSSSCSSSFLEQYFCLQIIGVRLKYLHFGMSLLGILLRWGFLIWELIFYLLRTFCPHLGSFFFVFLALSEDKKLILRLKRLISKGFPIKTVRNM